MKYDYQYGFDMFLFVVWFTVNPVRFGKAVAPLLLKPEQFDSITPGEVVPFFRPGFMLRDGWRLYRAIDKA